MEDIVAGPEVVRKHSEEVKEQRMIMILFVHSNFLINPLTFVVSGPQSAKYGHSSRIAEIASDWPQDCPAYL